MFVRDSGASEKRVLNIHLTIFHKQFTLIFKIITNIKSSKPLMQIILFGFQINNTVWIPNNCFTIYDPI